MSEPLSELLVSVLDDYLIDQAETMDREVVIARVAALETRLSKMEEAAAGAAAQAFICLELGIVTLAEVRSIHKVLGLALAGEDK